MKKRCEWQIYGFTRKRKIIYNAGGCETEIDFVLVRKNTKSM